MSDFDLWDSDAAAQSAPQVRQRQAANQLQGAIQAVERGYGQFLTSSTGIDEFEDRWHLAKNDIRRTVEKAGVFPNTGSMRRVHNAMKSLYKQAGVSINPSQPQGPASPMETGGLTSRDNAALSRIEMGKPMGDWADNAPLLETAAVKEAKKFLAWCRDANVRPTPELLNRYASSSESRSRIASTLNRLADATHPEMDLKKTFHARDDVPLIPKDNWEGYLNEVDQGAREKAERNLTSGGDSGTDAPSREAALIAMSVYSDWARSNGLRVASRRSLDLYAEAGLPEGEYRMLAAAIERKAGDTPPQFEKDDDSDDEPEDDDSEGEDDSEDGDEDDDEDSDDDNGESEDEDDSDDSDDSDGDKPPWLTGQRHRADVIPNGTAGAAAAPVPPVAPVAPAPSPGGGVSPANAADSTVNDIGGGTDGSAATRGATARRRQGSEYDDFSDTPWSSHGPEDFQGEIPSGLLTDLPHHDKPFDRDEISEDDYFESGPIGRKSYDYYGGDPGPFEMSYPREHGANRRQAGYPRYEDEGEHFHEPADDYGQHAQYGPRQAYGDPYGGGEMGGKHAVPGQHRRGNRQWTAADIDDEDQQQQGPPPDQGGAVPDQGAAPQGGPPPEAAGTSPDEGVPPEPAGGAMPPAGGATPGVENQPAEDALLDTANQAVQQMMQQETTEYQTIMQPLTQALQAIEFAQQVEQAEHPLDVTPPDGTVDATPSAAAEQPQVPPQQQPAAPPQPQPFQPQARKQAFRIAKAFNMPEPVYNTVLQAMADDRYRPVVDVLARLAPEKRAGVAEKLAEVFAYNNPRFNTEYFYRAAGLDTGSRLPFVDSNG